MNLQALQILFLMQLVDGQFQNIIERTMNTITGGVNVLDQFVAMKDPIDRTIVNMGSGQCENVKRIIGVEYDQYREEPNMRHVTLNFITQEVQHQYNLSSLSTLSSSEWFKPEKGLIIYLHGFTDSPLGDSYSAINNAFLARDTNILALDSSSLIRFFYLRSSTMVHFIGRALGAAVTKLIQVGLNPSSIHLIGHSLGSHIASFAGKTVLANTGQRVGRISGLDPAGPCFSDVAVKLRLNKEDADYVDVIHSDAGVYGLDEIVGHADYYPNKGCAQPGCLTQICSHSMAWHFFAESVINITGFPAVRCDSWDDFTKGNCNFSDISYMGYGSKPGTVGQYYLQTSDNAPYALGTNGVTFTDIGGMVNSLLRNLWQMSFI